MEKRDTLWKGIIEDFFSDFLDFFFQKHVKRIDKSKGFVFLDKELQKIYPKSEDTRRFTDKLVKVFLKNGKPVWILIHIEVQGYTDQNFDERMYIYQYRIFDRYKVPVTALAIFTDDDKNFHPKKYRVRTFDAIIQYQFPTYKLSEKTLADFQKTNNPFSIIMETAWWGLKKNKLTDKELFSKKIQLYRELRKLGLPQERISDLLTFINHYNPFENIELSLKFEEEIDNIENKKDTMGVKEALLDFHERKGIAIGEKKGEKKGVKTGLNKSVEIVNLLKEGKSPSDIAKKLKVDKSLVIYFKENMNL